MGGIDEVVIEWRGDDLNRIHVNRDGDSIVYQDTLPERGWKEPEVRTRTTLTPFRFLLKRFANNEGPGLLMEVWSYPGKVVSGLSEWEENLIPYFLWRGSFEDLLSLEDRHLEIISSKLGQEFYEQVETLKSGLRVLGKSIDLLFLLKEYELSDESDFWERLVTRVDQEAQLVLDEQKIEEENERLKLFHREFISSAEWDRESTNIRHVSKPAGAANAIADYVVVYIRKNGRYPTGEHQVAHGRGKQMVNVFFPETKLREK
jgi:hypothetical protein